MESTVTFYDGMDLDPADHNNLQQYAQLGLDHVVLDAITNQQRYAGFTISKTGVTTVALDLGRLYSMGKRYALNTITQQDFINSLPISGKKVVLAVVWGTEADTNVVPREFLINEETGASEPRAVSTRHDRVCNIQFAIGTEAPNPVDPLVSAGYTIVARIILTPSGVDTVQNYLANALFNIENLNTRLASVESFETSVEAQIATLTAELNDLAGRVAKCALNSELMALINRVAALEAKVPPPPVIISPPPDNHPDPSTATPSQPGYSCTIIEGVRFPSATTVVIVLALLSPTDPTVIVMEDHIFCPFTHTYWLSSFDQAKKSWPTAPFQSLLGGLSALNSLITGVGGVFLGEYVISTFQQNTLSRKQRHISRCRHRNGYQWAATDGQVFNHLTTANFVQVCFGKTGESFTAPANGDDQAYQTAKVVQQRLQYSWHDDYEDPYWDAIHDTDSLNGVHVAHSWTQGQDVWLSQIGIYFNQVAASGNVDIIIGECDNSGKPFYDRTMRRVTLTPAQMKRYPDETVVSFTPVHLPKGKKVFLAVVTAADHRLCKSSLGIGLAGHQHWKFESGVFVDISSYIAPVDRLSFGTPGIGFMFNLYRAFFSSTRLEIMLSPLQLAGGVYSLDAIFDAIIPDSCHATLEVQIGGSWMPITGNKPEGSWNPYILGSGTPPALVPIRLVYEGTQDILPCFKLATSQCTLGAAVASFTHFTATQTIPNAGTATVFQVVQRYQNWNGANHTVNCYMMTGGSYATVNNPTSHTDSDVKYDDRGNPYIERTWNFTLGGAVGSFQIKTTGSTTAQNSQFVLVQTAVHAIS